jgi:hypothetical protein
MWGPPFIFTNTCNIRRLAPRYYFVSFKKHRFSLEPLLRHTRKKVGCYLFLRNPTMQVLSFHFFFFWIYRFTCAKNLGVEVTCWMIQSNVISIDFRSVFRKCWITFNRIDNGITNWLVKLFRCETTIGTCVCNRRENRESIYIYMYIISYAVE